MAKAFFDMPVLSDRQCTPNSMIPNNSIPLVGGSCTSTPITTNPHYNYIHKFSKHIHPRKQAAQAKATYEVTRVAYTVSSRTIILYP